MLASLFSWCLVSVEQMLKDEGSVESERDETKDELSYIPSYASKWMVGICQTGIEEKLDDREDATCRV